MDSGQDMFLIVIKVISNVIQTKHLVRFHSENLSSKCLGNVLYY